MSSAQVLIVGAGPTGLVLALQLARRGVPFRLIDKSGGPGLASRAMVVHARTLEFYRQLGFGDEIVALGIPMERIQLREDGRDVATLSFGALGAGISPFPFALCFPQDDHERWLTGKLADLGISVERGVTLTHFNQKGDAVHATLDRNGSEELADFAFLVGCDGAHSAVRQGLGLQFPGGTYEQLFYVADVGIDDGSGRDMLVSLAPQGLALMLPVRSSGMYRLIGIVPADLSAKPDLSFADVRPSAEALLGCRVDEVNWFSTYHVHHRVAPHFRLGRCFIAGDAGHIHSPAGGQGMNTGIGDAVNLAWKLAQVLQGRATPALLDTYESERIGFARTLVATTDKAFQRVTGQGHGGQFLRTVLIPHLLPFLTGFSAVRRLLFNTVSQVRLSYHESALSEGEAGDVHGGDRLPWVEGDGGDNFAALRSLDWQLHVYGSCSALLRSTAIGLGLALQVYGWSEAAGQAGLRRDAAYLIRPDGYVALALPTQDATLLVRYAAERGFALGR